MSSSSACPVSTGYVNFSVIGVHSTWNRRPHSYIRLSRRALTIATLSWRVRRKRRPTNCNECGQRLSGTRKFDRGLSRLLHIELYWLDVPERVMYKLGVMVFNYMHDQAPPYLVELCQPVAGVTSRQHLRSATQQFLVVQRHIGSAPMADRLSVWLDHRSGIPCRTACGIRLLAGTVSDNL